MSNVTISKLSDGTNVGYFAPQAYFECSTAADASAKTATSPDNVTFTNTSLVRGITVFVKFVNANTADSPTLQIGTSTAKSISGETIWDAGDIISFTYDGTDWVRGDYKGTTYTFTDGTNGFTVTPSGGTAQTVNVTPSIANNVTGSGTSGYIAKFSGANTLENGPQIGSDTSKFLRNDGTWATPPATTVGTLNTNNTSAQTVPTSAESFTGNISLHKVSKTGSYNDLNNKPTIPTVGTLNTTNTSAQSTSASESLGGTVNLHKVAKTGTYSDLIGRPTIPDAPGTLNTTATTSQTTSASEALSGSVTLHKVSKTGDYGDLLNKPTDANGIVPISNGGTGIDGGTTDDWYENILLHPHFTIVYDPDDSVFSGWYLGPTDGISDVSSALASSAVQQALHSVVPIRLGNVSGNIIGTATIMSGAFIGSPSTLYILFPDSVSFGGAIVNGMRASLAWDSSDSLLYFTSMVPSQPYWYTSWRPSLFFDGLDGEGQLGPSRTLDTLYQSNGVIYASATDIAITSNKVTANSTAATIATGDTLIIGDSSASNTLAKTSISFDTANSTQFLRKDGTWATPSQTAVGALSISSSAQTVPSTSESFSGNITLHKVSKTGSFSDLSSKPSATISGLSASKTITALSETDGVISATASDIAIAGSQVTSKVTSASNADVATKLGTSTVGSTQRPIYLNAGTPTVTNPGEAFLSWGGQNWSANNGPLDAALINTLGADRFAFIPAACTTVEYSTDAGATWQDYGLSDSNKVALFAPGLGVAVYLGKHTTAGSGTANDQLRITVDTYSGSQRVYSAIKKFVMYGSTNGAANTTWSLQVRTTANVLNNVDTWSNVFTDVAWGGWSGINIAQTDVTIGSNAPTSTSNTQYRQFRLIFKQGTPSASYASSQIIYIMGYGGVGWSTPSNMAKYNSLYSYDASQNATFPARVKATEFKGLGANYYGTCTTAAATDAKVVTCPDFVLTTGARISVKFTNGSTSTGTMTLNVNSTGAKNCGVYLYNNTWQNYANRCEKNEVLEFIYDGTYWVTITPYTLRNYHNYNSRSTSANGSSPNAGLQYILATSSMTTGKPPTDAAILNMNWDNGTIWGKQLAVGLNGRVFTRAQQGSAAWTDWKEIPRLSGALTNGQIVVSDESTGNALLKGGPAIDTTDTTKFLRHDGTWQVPSAGLPSVTSADNGKVLMVVNGAWAVASLPLYDGSVT